MTYQADLAALTVNDWNPKRDMYVECTKFNWNDELYLIKMYNLSGISDKFKYLSLLTG